MTNIGMNKYGLKLYFNQGINKKSLPKKLARL